MRTSSGSFHGESSEDALVVDAADSPDPRWPLLNRWSQSAKPVKSRPRTLARPLADESSTAVSSRTNPPPPLVGSSSSKIDASLNEKANAQVTAVSTFALPVQTSHTMVMATDVALAKGSSPVESPRNTSPVLVGSSPRKITDFFSSSKAKSPLTSEAPISRTVPSCPGLVEPSTCSDGKALKEQLLQRSPSVDDTMKHVPTGSGPPV